MHHAKDFICLGRRKWRRGRNRDYSFRLCPLLWPLTHKSTQEHEGYSEGRWCLLFCTCQDLSLHDNSVQSFSGVWLFATLWTAAHQGSLSITNSQSLLRHITCPLNQWCHPTISSSVVPFTSCLQTFPASGSFPMSQLFASGGQSKQIKGAISIRGKIRERRNKKEEKQ